MERSWWHVQVPERGTLWETLGNGQCHTEVEILRREREEST